MQYWSFTAMYEKNTYILQYFSCTEKDIFGNALSSLFIKNVYFCSYVICRGGEL